ncbi:MAG: low molecular weight phosphotyrosine protein phosphatase [Paludibacteraceae bacterium]|nr:low molecular weight phosphotyrosine protein phosphatase [Paludibacteraceae bacterium]
MKKILFICHGNICRSPMAEFVLKKMIKDRGLENEFEIASAATSTEELGNPVYPPARRKLAEHGIKCDGKTARQVTKKDGEYYDYLIVMDEWNRRNLSRIISADAMSKVSLLMSWAGENREVSDPWYTGDFDAAWRDINIGCNAVLRLLYETILSKGTEIEVLEQEG